MKYDRYPIPTECPYCKAEEIIHTTNDYLYGRKYYKGGNCNCYVCIVCKASVGTHPDGITPLGRLADKELKTLKKEAHALFDPLWKSGERSRNQAYKWLAKKLGISVRECHFGHFDKTMLQKAIEILSKVQKGGYA